MIGAIGLFLGVFGCASFRSGAGQSGAKLYVVDEPRMVSFLRDKGFRGDGVGRFWQDPQGTRVFVEEEVSVGGPAVFMLSAAGVQRIGTPGQGEWVSFEGKIETWPGWEAVARRHGSLCVGEINSGSGFWSELDEVAEWKWGGGQPFAHGGRLYVNSAAKWSEFARSRAANCREYVFADGHWRENRTLYLLGEIFGGDPLSDDIVVREVTELPVLPRVMVVNLSTGKRVMLGWGLNVMPLFLTKPVVPDSTVRSHE